MPIEPPAIPTIVDVAPRDTDPDRTRLVLLSLPLELGVSTHRRGGGAIGVRPELVLALHAGDDERVTGSAIGVYGELVVESAAELHGAGATYVRYMSGVAIAPSIGLYDRASPSGPDERGVTASLFVGKRGWVPFGPLDGPYGVRLDARFATDGSHDRSVMVTGQIDALVIAAFAAAFVEVLFLSAHELAR